MTDPKLFSRTTTFDALFGKPTTVLDANGLKTTAVYDVLGRVTAVTDPARQGAATPSRTFNYAARCLAGKG